MRTPGQRPADETGGDPPQKQDMPERVAPVPRLKQIRQFVDFRQTGLLFGDRFFKRRLFRIDVTAVLARGEHLLFLTVFVNAHFVAEMIHDVPVIVRPRPAAAQTFGGIENAFGGGAQRERLQNGMRHLRRVEIVSQPRIFVFVVRLFDVPFRPVSGQLVDFLAGKRL